ncbi:hypothetical protein BH09BAC5_BH09BAC5_18320 [soil metagenome]
MTEVENILNATTEPKQESTQKRSWWKRILRAIIWTGSIFLFLILLLVALTYFYQDKVKGYVIAEVNKRVNTTIIINPEDIDITIVKTFPDVSVIFKNIAALDAVKSSKRDTLLKAESISLGFNIMDLFHGNYSIHNIKMSDGIINVWVDEKGKDNYHFLKETTDTSMRDTSHVEFALEKITLKNIVCTYHDKKSKSYYKSDFHTLSFTGNFGTDQYDFGTDADFTIQKIMLDKSQYFAGDAGSLHVLVEIDNKTGQYILRKGKIKIADLAIDITGNITEQKKNYLLDLAVKGDDIDLPAAMSLLPAPWSEEVKNFNSTGEFYIDGSIKGLFGDSLTPDINTKFGVNNGATLSRKDGSVSLSNIVLDGFFSNVKGNDGLQINSFKANSKKSKFTGSFLVKDFTHPNYKTKLSGHIDLEEMQKIISIDTIENISGIMDLEFEASGSPAKGNTLTAKDFRTFKTNGKLNLADCAFKLTGQTFQVDSINGNLLFDGNNVSAEGFTARTGNSDLRIDARVNNLLGYLFTEKEVLAIDGQLNSKNIDLNTLLNSDKSDNKKTDTTYKLVMPERLRLNLKTTVKHILFRKFEGHEMIGDFNLNHQRLLADPLSFKAMDGSFSGSGMIDGTRDDSLLITCNAAISSVNIYKLFYQMENFGQEDDTTITYNNLRGDLDAHVNFASLWGNDLNVNENKIYTDADVTINNGELINFRPLEALSKFIKLDDLKDIKFKSLHNNIEIKNRLISMPKMEINSSAINIIMSGTHDFDNNVNYHFIVDMDEIRAKKAKAAKPQNTEFGVEEEDGGHRTRLFITMKGYVGNPDIKYDAKGAAQSLKEDLHQEKQNLKSILHDEFGWFKGDKQNKEERKKDDSGGKFILKQDDNPKSKDKKKKGEDLDDNDDY